MKAGRMEIRTVPLTEEMVMERVAQEQVQDREMAQALVQATVPEVVREMDSATIFMAGRCRVSLM
jgi:hypothetical protein